MFKRIDHTEIVPSDVEKTVGFYQDILGFTMKKRVSVAAPPIKEVIYLELGNTMIEVISAEGVFAKSREVWQVGYRAIALEVDNMEKTVVYLKERGVAITKGPVDLGTSIRGEIQDPDGLIIELRQWK
jgi:catechol 2,3-dioxygenase-like lactoylglutathione lyase family enzyme